MESLDEDIEALKRRNIKLEAYTRRENVRIVNVKEEVEENTRSFKKPACKEIEHSAREGQRQPL